MADLDRQSGGASRFFAVSDWAEDQLGADAGFRYCAKPSRAERNAGLDGFVNVALATATSTTTPAINGNACSSGQSCEGGSCGSGCVFGDDCDGRCVDTNDDPRNCGACGAACPMGQVCSLGACTVTCAAGLTDCSGRCINLKTEDRKSVV